jgi:hypothetical protein
MKALNGKKIVKGICFVLIFAGLFWFTQRLLQAKWVASDKETSASTSAWQEYRSLEENSIDVLFLGTSHTYSGIDPMYMYGQSGLTSFVLGGAGMHLDATYLVLEDALKTQSPSVIFLDMSAIHYEEQLEEAKAHKTIDQLPITLSKIEYAFNTESEELSALDVLFPLFRYHTRWESLEKDDFKYTTGELPTTSVRGHYITYRTKATELYFNEDEEFTLTDRNWDYMQRIAKLCEENDIELVLYKIPSPTWYASQSQGSQEVADKLGLTYLELYYDVDEIGLDVTKDFRDRKDHLNQNGADKVSQYMLDYIQENYDFADQRDNNERWDTDYVQYLKIVEQQYKKYNQ